MQILGKPSSMASSTFNTLLQHSHVSSIPLCKYTILSSSPHLFTISTLRLKHPQEFSPFYELRPHAIGATTNTAEQSEKDTDSGISGEMGSGFSSLRSMDKWGVRKSKKNDGIATESKVSTSSREMGSGFSSLRSKDKWVVKKSMRIDGKAAKSVDSTTSGEMGSESSYFVSSSEDEGSEGAEGKFKKNTRRSTRADTRIHRNDSSSLSDKDEWVDGKSKKNESNLDGKRERKFRRHIHQIRSVDNGEHREIRGGFASVRPRDDRVTMNLRKTENGKTADDKKGKKNHLDTTNQLDSKSHEEMGDGSSALWSKIKRVDKKLKNKMTSPVVDEKIERRSKKKKVNSTEFQLRVGLDMCSKKGDVMEALSLYDSALKEGIKLGQYHYNVLLYLSSSAAVGIIQPAKSGTSSSRSFDKMDSTNDLSSKNLLDSSENRQIGTGDELRENSSDSRCYSDKISSSSDGLAVGSTEHKREDVLNEMDQNTLFSNGFGVGGNKGDSKNATYESDSKVDNKIQVSDDVKRYALARGFEIYEKMCLEKIPLSEAALTSVARMAMSMGNGDMAFEMVKQMKALGINPRLRSYGPALFAFCTSGDIKKAFEVEQHMLESGVYPEEPELEALLRLCISAGRGEKVYYLLHKLRKSVRQVSPSTAHLIENWFESTSASRVGKRKWDVTLILQAMENGGGGWHGLGWLGKGKWTVARTTVGSDGVCMCCGEKLATIDLDPVETENFAKSVAALAAKRERSSTFQTFQKWLDYYGPFEAVVDAANVGLFSRRRFLLSKVNAVVNGIRQQLPSKKWPLIILHNKRISGGKMNEPPNKMLIEKWKNADALYATPTGSNDDWYWLYAAVKFKCLIVTNDEMRDHIFQTLGNDFFPKWKERHQVRFSFRDGSPEFEMPPPCSVVIQESEKGHWHVPIASELESKREGSWLCVTRASSHAETLEASIKPKFAAETLPQTRKETTGLDAATCSRMKVLPSDHANREKPHPKGSYPNQKMYRNPRKVPPTAKFPIYQSIISDIEAAENLAGCVIDFQI
ncbi:proteinaceous RNase P 1, chloroplastic/mitochondrial-like protein isoform X1 [Cinnamomum micranthum f. kanehirae]|uniref:ribonuclease P n=1 Tax=Cinnamomum micranthum f. kanehirae TaxID=337451 RepID=A0A3S4N6R6_9MAGN|nr:proteinaceous RNase P 1, chloroplastic/mitochondrial-like protein isoform X1 [Cinnamomum micranthum f. kanehirae]